MRTRQLVSVAVVAMAGSILPVSAATAATQPFLKVEPRVVDVGGDVTVKGFCDAPGEHLVKSTGFAAPIPLNGKGKAGSTLGEHKVVLICGNQPLIDVINVRAKPGSLSVLPKEVQPGGKIELLAYCQYGAGNQATSPGFAKPIALDFRGHSGQGRGVGTAATKPGRYTATFDCRGTAAKATFTIVEKPKPGKPKPPQVVVKPKGAPETGAGFLAMAN